MANPSYDHVALEKFAQALLTKAGLPPPMARDVAEVLVAGDLLGKTTHGLRLLAPYLRSLDAKTMTRTGRPKVLKKSATTLLLDANYLPGPYVVRESIRWAQPRAKKHGVATVSIRRCHHIACLQAYLEPVTERGLVILLMCSDPAVATVAAPGSTQGVVSPNPIAAGFPTKGTPILIDTTTSSASNGQVALLRQQKRKFSSACLQTSRGIATNDPAALYTTPPGSIFPLGGPELGHKGFALSLIVEALSNALAGHGRADRPDCWGASVFMQIINPAFFGGTRAFSRETNYLAQTCQKAKGKRRGQPVRLPGEQALARRRSQLAHGVALELDILPALEPWTLKYGLKYPQPN